MPQTCKGTGKPTQATNTGREGVTGGHGSPSSARGDPTWSSCASAAPTVPLPTPGRTPGMRPPLPGRLEQGLGEPSSSPEPVPGLLGSPGTIPPTRPKQRLVPGPGILKLSPLSAGSGEQSPARPEELLSPGLGTREGRAAQAGLPAEPRHPTQRVGTPCPLLAAPHAGQRRTLGMAVWGRVRSCVAAVQPHPMSQELAAGELNMVNGRSQGQRGRR